MQMQYILLSLASGFSLGSRTFESVEEAEKLGFVTVQQTQNWFWDMGEVIGHFNGKPFRDSKKMLETPAKWPQQLKTCRIQGQGRQLRLEKYLGAGAGGRVFLGSDEHGSAAVKFTNVELSNPGFQKELRVLRRIGASSARHLNGLNKDFLSTTTCCGIPCMVVDLISGQNLVEMMDERGLNYENKYVTASLMARQPAALQKITPLEVSELRSMVLQGLVAYVEMEQLGLCNSDQNLRNVMRDDDGTVEFIDFGHVSERQQRCKPGFFAPDKLPYDNRNGVPQAWPTLQYLLRDPAEQKRYADLCARVNRQSSSVAALRHEVSLAGSAQGFLELSEAEAARVEELLGGSTPGPVAGPAPEPEPGPAPSRPSKPIAEPAPPVAPAEPTRHIPSSLPEGWRQTVFNGQVAYVNVHTNERIFWQPKYPAATQIYQSPDLQGQRRPGGQGNRVVRHHVPVAPTGWQPSQPQWRQPSQPQWRQPVWRH